METRECSRLVKAVCPAETKNAPPMVWKTDKLYQYSVHANNKSYKFDWYLQSVTAVTEDISDM